MKFIGIPGVNGLGKTKNTARTFESFFSGPELKIEEGNISSQFNKILDFSRAIKSKYFFFGGDHSISYPLVKGIFERNRDMKLVVFDAHPDLVEPMREPTHEEWLRALINNGFPSENILIFGVRRHSSNVDKSELSFARRKEIKIIFSDEVDEKKRLFEDFVSQGKIYLSLDIDVLDKNTFSSTGYPEEDGLSDKQFFSFLDIAIERGDIFWTDLVEISNEVLDEEKALVRKILKRFNLE